MQFILIDQITELNEGSDITAIKALSIAEEYLRDHFPLFPVMPGVLMLEGLFQASAWLVRQSEDFSNSMVILKEARNVKYSGFVTPGQTLLIKAAITKQDETTTSLKATGEVDGETVLSCKLLLERFNLKDRYPDRASMDAYAIKALQEQFSLLYHPTTD
jgi:3-hydroxyacyl-[acyl-carrier-protein] dehydratase